MMNESHEILRKKEMKNPTKLLRETIKLLIAEELQQPSLGFTTVKDQRGMIIGVVFDTTNILQTIENDPDIKKHIDILDRSENSSVSKYSAMTNLSVKFRFTFEQAFYDSIVAMVAVQPPLYTCAKSYEIKFAAGPGEREIIADMLAHMSAITGTNRYIADREFVSSAGRAAWWLMSRRVPDDGKIPLDNVEHPPKGKDPFHDKHHTPDDPDDDCSTYLPSPGNKKDRTLDAINHALTVKPTGKHNMQSYENNAKGLFQAIRNSHGPISGLFDVTRPIESATLMYFDNHFNELRP